MTNDERARELMADGPMTRYALQRRLGITQQRASEVLARIGAGVVGTVREPGRRSSPLYGFAPPKAEAQRVRVSSVWELGAA